MRAYTAVSKQAGDVLVRLLVAEIFDACEEELRMHQNCVFSAQIRRKSSTYRITSWILARHSSAWDISKPRRLFTSKRKGQITTTIGEIS